MKKKMKKKKKKKVTLILVFVLITLLGGTRNFSWVNGHQVGKKRTFFDRQKVLVDGVAVGAKILPGNKSLSS